MMLYPPMAELVNKVGSRYLLVNLVARRARKHRPQGRRGGDVLERKPSPSPLTRCTPAS